MHKKIGVVGAGAWGTAIANVLAKNGYEVLLWCYEEQLAQEINQQHTNSLYMPGHIFSDKVHATHDLQYLFKHTTIIFEAVPVQFLRSVLLPLAGSFAGHQFVCLSKGIEASTLMVPSSIIQDIAVGHDVPIAVISGPSFAQELVAQQLTAVNIAATDTLLSQTVTQLLMNDYFSLCYTEDVIGIQIAAALKNVITLMVGIAQGVGCGDNTRAMIMTIGLAEIARLVVAMGGKQEAVYGLAGLGDLLLTATGSLSKNLKAGIALGQGQSVQQIMQTGIVAEGLNTIKSINELSQQYKVSMPMCNELYAVVYEGTSIKKLLPTLFNCLVI